MMAAPIITAAVISPECPFMFMPIRRTSGIVGSLTFATDYCIEISEQYQCPREYAELLSFAWIVA
jgi:hypothetical protein